MEDAYRQQLTQRKSLKKVKIRKKIIFSNGPKPLFSCQNAQKMALFCCQYVFWRVVRARLGVDGEQLTEFIEITLFPVKNSKQKKSQKNGVRNMKTGIFLTPFF
jgi:hypothetical protein